MLSEAESDFCKTVFLLSFSGNADSHEIFWVMRNQKIHYCAHKSPSLDLISATELCETF